MAMRDLTEYARRVDGSTTLDEAQRNMIELIDQFQHKDKQQLFKVFVQKRASKASLQKWAWDLVLVGQGLKVHK